MQTSQTFKSEGSSTSTILSFNIVFLILSHLRTYMLIFRREEAVRRDEMRRTEEREKWLQDTVTALWELSVAPGDVSLVLKQPRRAPSPWPRAGTYPMMHGRRPGRSQSSRAHRKWSRSVCGTYSRTWLDWTDIFSFFFLIFSFITVM